MRKLCLVILFLTLPLSVFAQNLPQPEGRVNDFAGVISQEYTDKLDALIQEVDDKTSAEIAVVTINSIAPYDEKAYAQMLFDSWKPGKKGKDNGVLVLLAIKERRWHIETGYGAEGILPDGLCGEIGRNYMVAYLKEGKFSEGLYSGVLQLAKVIAKDANVKLEGVPLTVGASENDPITALMVFTIIFTFVILSSILSSRQKRKGNYYGAGAWGAGSGGFGGGSFGGGGFGGGFGGGGSGGGGAGGGF
jgi:uncharacterized protein